MLARGPHVARYTWVGWEGGWETKKKTTQDKGDEKGQVDVEAIPADQVGSTTENQKVSSE